MKNLIQTCKHLGWIVILLSFLGTQTVAHRPPVVLPGIWCSRHETYVLSAQQQDTLQTSLRRITGWTQLSLTENGKLEIGDFAAIAGGSRRARLALLQTLRSGNQFVIENHSASAAVNFGQLDEGTNYADDRSGLKLDVYRVRLDFTDFDKMSAAPAVLKSFDEGFTFLHELLHGLGLKDTAIPNEIGDCETAVNQMRAELGLPLRDQYLADLLRVTPIIKTIRLRFKAQMMDRQGVARWKTQHLYFTPDIAIGRERETAAQSAACLSLY